MRLHRLSLPLALLAVLGALAPEDAGAQSLRGSRASIDRMYRQAQGHDLTFFRTSLGVRQAHNAGKLVRLSGNADYRVAGVRYPYVLPTTRTFVQRLARQYRQQCGEKLVVTSATRPRSFRLVNATDKSVHPTGMAIDLRKPQRRACLAWLRETLLHVERQGVAEATEENRPPHFHVAVFPSQYRRYVNARGGGSSGGSAPARATYRVRRGDSLWAIARRHNTSVDRIKEANDLRSSRVIAGQLLVIPGR